MFIRCMVLFIIFLTSNEEFKYIYFGLNNIFSRVFLFPTFLNIKSFPIPRLGLTTCL